MTDRVARAGIAAVVAALVVCPTAGADLADETALAEKHAPVVRLVEQVEECGHGEPFQPIDVDLLLLACRTAGLLTGGGLLSTLEGRLLPLLLQGRAAGHSGRDLRPVARAGILLAEDRTLDLVEDTHVLKPPGRA